MSAFDQLAGLLLTAERESAGRSVTIDLFQRSEATAEGGSLAPVWGEGAAARYEALDNIAPEAEGHALARAEDIARLAAATEPAIVVHSHPNGWQCPSAADMRAQQAWGVPFVVLPIGEDGPLGPAFGWGHEDLAPYEGRPFRHGIRDCYALVRDWMARERQIQLEDVGICEEVQKGLASRSYDTGRFSVRREVAGYHFHRLLARRLVAGLDGASD